MVDGFAIVADVLGHADVSRLTDAVERSRELGDSGRGGIRNLLDRVPKVRSLAESPSIRALVEPVLGKGAFAARGILFDKTPDANWKVPWHQDLTIAVQRRMDVAGFGPWTIKDGVHHVQPPVGILENMLAVRLHLDDCGEENGPLKVIPGSHRNGRLTAEQIQTIASKNPDVSCPVGRGGAVLMRPLLLHASSVARSPRHRRVVHIEFAASGLPGGLRWMSESTGHLTS
jgi:ectoine hydroxylase-related dioxygenase (phytanoyl-CoA dioxygenase family)